MLLRQLKNFLNARIITGVTATSIMILSFAWLFAEGGYEPALAAIVGASGFAATFKYSFLSFDRNLTADRIALVVGNSDYGFSKLNNAAKDVEDVCDALAAKGSKS